ncbi:MAG: family 78 glycoside hydrolase catalytic domain [Clostridia bacterium]|nr:family 78 glycoside hydrolase catalytic domain [Clostridia bacterium]
MNNIIFADSKWISDGRSTTSGETGYLMPVLEFRRQFYYERRSDKAVCYISGLGFFELFINGEKVGNEVLTPSFSNYDKRYYYCVFDIADYLEAGKNIIAIKVGNGHYNQTEGDAWRFESASWRDTPKLLFSLFVGDRSVLNSDTSWKVRRSKTTYHNSLRTGEFYDATQEDGFMGLDYIDDVWANAKIVVPPAGVATQEFMPPIRECEAIRPIDIWRSEKGWVFDFGVNIAGYAEISAEEKAGVEAVMRYAERLNGKEIDQKEIDKHIYSGEGSCDKYKFKGVGRETWKPSFTYHGFRYVEIAGLSKEPDKNTLKAYFIHTDFERVGDFSTSDELLIWAYESGIRSFLSNYQSFPTDCPHREKNGWTGDAQLSCEYALRIFDMENAYKKWLTDILDCQKDNGIIPCIVPTSAWGYTWGSGPAWDYALFKIPYAIYKETGKTECLELVYEAAQKYLDYALHYRQGGLVEFGLGDWCYPLKVKDIKVASNEFSDSCYYYDMQKISAFIAELKGDTDKARQYSEAAEQTRQAIVKKYISDNVVDGGGQGAAALVLRFGIVDGEIGKKIADKLAEIIKKDEYQIKVGILGFKALMYALPQYGYQDVVYKMLARYEYPSFGYWKNQGATSLWEDWEGSQSLNHHMYGTVIDYLQRDIAGVKNVGVAYDKVLFEPYFYAENCSASLYKNTKFGKLVFGWEKTGKTIRLNAVVPSGIEAKIKLFGEVYDIKVGEWSHSVSM